MAGSMTSSMFDLCAAIHYGGRSYRTHDIWVLLNLIQSFLSTGVDTVEREMCPVAGCGYTKIKGAGGTGFIYSEILGPHRI